MKSLRDEIPLTRGYGEADLISSEALAEDFIQTRLDFILQSRISFLLFFPIYAILIARGDIMPKNYLLIYSEQIATEIELLCQNI